MEKLIGGLTYGPVLVLGILWFLMDKKRRNINLLMFIYPLTTMIPTAITCSEDRYRMPFDIFLIILACAGIAYALGYVRPANPAPDTVSRISDPQNR